MKTINKVKIEGASKILRPEAKEFLSHLPQEYSDGIIADFANYLETGAVDSRLGDRVRNFCAEGSQIIPLPLGSWRLTERIYAGDCSGHFFDDYIVTCISGRATQSRFNTIVDRLPALIDVNKKGDWQVWSLGSGPGNDMLQLLKANPGLKNLKVVCVDKDSEAVLAGEKEARILNLQENVQYIPGDFRQALSRAGKKPDLILLIGIICPMNAEKSAQLLRILKRCFKPGSLLIVSSALDTMRQQDPFSCYLIHLILRWRLEYKNKEQFRVLVEKAGYTWEGLFTDHLGYHGMALARVPLD